MTILKQNGPPPRLELAARNPRLPEADFPTSFFIYFFLTCGSVQPQGGAICVGEGTHKAADADRGPP